MRQDWAQDPGGLFPHPCRDFRAAPVWFLWSLASFGHTSKQHLTDKAKFSFNQVIAEHETIRQSLPPPIIDD